MDQTFSRWNMSLMPLRWEGGVARAFMDTAPGRHLYQQQLPKLYSNTWDTAYLVRRVDEMNALLKPVFAEQSREARLEHSREVTALRARIQQRGTFMAAQFAGTNWMNVRAMRRLPIGFPDEP
jgi:hypothetical protein